jgi:hypothetical protein
VLPRPRSAADTGRQDPLAIIASQMAATETPEEAAISSRTHIFVESGLTFALY